jgi:hypothetical protein
MVMGIINSCISRGFNNSDRKIMPTVRFIIVDEDDIKRGKGIANFTYRGQSLEFKHGEVYRLWPDLIAYIEAQCLHYINNNDEMCWEQRYYFEPEEDFCFSNPQCFKEHKCKSYWKHKKTGHIVEDGDLVPIMEHNNYEKVK